MVRITNGKKIFSDNLEGAYYIEASGVSTDTKPDENVATGSIFTEVDTGKVYFFDEESGDWVEQFSFQG